MEWSQDAFKDQDRALLNTYTQGNNVNRELGKHDTEAWVCRHTQWVCKSHQKAQR